MAKQLTRLTLFRLDILGIDIGAVRSISDVLSVHSSVDLVMVGGFFVLLDSLSAVFIVVTTIVSDD